MIKYLSIFIINIITHILFLEYIIYNGLSYFYVIITILFTYLIITLFKIPEKTNIIKYILPVQFLLLFYLTFFKTDFFYQYSIFILFFHLTLYIFDLSISIFYLKTGNDIILSNIKYIILIIIATYLFSKLFSGLSIALDFIQYGL